LDEEELRLFDDLDGSSLEDFVRGFVEDVIYEGGCGLDDGSVLIVPPTGEIKLTRWLPVKCTNDFSTSPGATLEPFLADNDQPQPETEKAT
jgi:hypothetical protein